MNISIRSKIPYFIITAALLLSSFTSCRQDRNTGAAGASSFINATPSKKEAIDAAPENSKTSEDYDEKIKSDGDDAEKIESAELYVKRIVLQLGEIQTFGNNLQPSSVNIDPYNEKSDDSIRYSELSSKIDEDKAIHYLVALEDSFSSMEEIFDEYLLSLQLDIDFDTCVTDKSTYDNLREEKLSQIAESGLITVDDIERKALESLQKLNNSSDSPGIGTGNDIYNPSVNPIPDMVNPQPELPNVDIPRPIDPTEEFKK